ncbi:M14 family zinc carboxypeptidase [Natrarchaeobius sp. A-rgal3]|uniref:M14 family zinc carboxypeptidase n=1 Tax=Natrarchaeobius versutus TaxID=1679078 RepID=UPI00350E93CF
MDAPDDSTDVTVDSDAPGTASTHETGTGRVTIRTTHPGGNGRVLEVAGDVIRLEPEIRDSTRRWFYWNVDVESDVSQVLEVRFPTDEVVGPRGPAVRTGVPCGSPTADGAWSEWRWLGADRRLDANAFRYAFDAGERAQLSLSFPYQRADFDAFALEFASDPRVSVETLTTTHGGREVPVVRLGTESGTELDGSAGDIVLAARHHACESIGSYVLEGTLRELLEGETGPALLERYRVYVYPFVDLDGVERGDPGKHRAPHDHNRDYVDSNAIAHLSPIYPTTAAIAGDLESLENLVVALDLHSPYKWGGDVNDRPFFVTDPDDPGDPLRTLASALESATTRRASDGPTLSFDAAPGTGLASFDGQSGLLHTFTRYCWLEGATLSSALEIPYVGTEDDPVTPSSARRLGRDLAVALLEWVDSGN